MTAEHPVCGVCEREFPTGANMCTAGLAWHAAEAPRPTALEEHGETYNDLGTTEPTWMAVLEAVKAYERVYQDYPVTSQATYERAQGARQKARRIKVRAMQAWKNDMSQGPDGYPMPPEPTDLHEAELARALTELG